MEFKLDFDTECKKMIQRFERVGKETGREAEKIVNVILDKLHGEAVDRVPVDEGFLEKSFEKKIIKALHAGNVIGHVFIPANAPASDYALWIHEAEYELGERSKQKDASVRADVGRKYLERALSENERAFGLYIYKRLKELLA